MMQRDEGDGRELTKEKQPPRPALHEAVRKGDLKRVRELLSGENGVNDTDILRQTALHIAACEGNLEVIKLLVKHKAELNATDRNGCTPLHCACRYMRASSANLLLRAGADPSLCTNTGLGPLHCLAASGLPLGRPNLVKILLQKYKCDVNAVDKLGQTPLHKAVQSGASDIALFLLTYAGNPNTMDRLGNTPLHAAVHTGRANLVRMLLEHNANLDAEGVIELVSNTKGVKRIVKEFLAHQPGGKRKISQMQARKPAIVASCFEELPVDIQKNLEEYGMGAEQVNQNFAVLINCLRFTTTRKFRVPDGERLPESHRRRPPQIATEASLTSSGDPRKIFKKLEIFGKGGFGRVYSAVSSEYKAKVAIKRMPYGSEKDKQLALSEVYCLQKYSHANIVKYYASYVARDIRELWVVMEFMEGGTLGEAAAKAEMEERHIAYIAREVLCGIHYLHTLGHVHRDLKSANVRLGYRPFSLWQVMLAVTGEVKLIDFGLVLDMSEGESVSMVGSPYWLPPEMVLQKPHGFAADVWSFAICLLELANKNLPFDRIAVKCMFNVATGHLPGLDRPDKWSTEFAEFLALCLVADPARRATPTQLLKHSWLKQAAGPHEMQDLLRQIFLGQALLNSGLF